MFSFLKRRYYIISWDLHNQCTRLVHFPRCTSNPLWTQSCCNTTDSSPNHVCRPEHVFSHWSEWKFHVRKATTLDQSCDCGEEHKIIDDIVNYFTTTELRWDTDLAWGNPPGRGWRAQGCRRTACCVSSPYADPRYMRRVHSGDTRLSRLAARLPSATTKQLQWREERL